MAFDFSGKSVIVTGAAGGLGKAIAKGFLAAGANVHICDINKTRLDETNDELAKAFDSGNVLATQVDITQEDSIQSLIRSTVEKFGKLDVLVNNAGIIDRFDPVGTMPRDVWDRVIAINLTAPYLTSKYAVKQMLAQEPKGGTIINIASVSGNRGFFAGAAYTSSKHGILGLTKNTAAFYGKHGIRCIAVQPGGMATNIAEHLAAGVNQDGYKLVMHGQALQPRMCDLDKVAKTVMFMSSADASVCNGACVVADEGGTAA